MGIFVVTGSADASQKKSYDELATTANRVMVVLNKIDEWDELDDSALLELIEQWKVALGVKKIYPCCAKGYDPKYKKGSGHGSAWYR